MATKLQKLLDAKPQGRKCSTCAKHPPGDEIHAVIKELLDIYATGYRDMSLRSACDRVLVPDFGFKLGWTALHKHVERCLKRDPLTGKKL